MTSRSVLVLLSLLLLRQNPLFSEIQFKTQGYLLQLDVSNQSTFGSSNQLISYAPWVGGLIDTSMSGTQPPIAVVTTGNEGWAGPLYEFAPGTDPADTIWEASTGNPVEPTGWSDYWGEGFPFNPLSDQDLYCRYRDISTIPNHTPLDLDIVQSSFAWSDPDAEGMIIAEYRISTTTNQPIQQAWLGLYAEASQIPTVANYASTQTLSYFLTDNPPLSAVGVAFLFSSLDPGSLGVSYAWYEGPVSPSTDSLRYAMMSSGTIMPQQDPPGSARSVLSFGPFTLDSAQADTVVFAVALLAGEDLADLEEKAAIAREIYQNGGLMTNVNDDAWGPVGFALHPNYPNPFNPTTTIRFSIPTAGDVSLKIFNLLGEEVATLISGNREAGAHTVQWDAIGQPSAVYFYRLQAGEFVETRKLILLR